MAATETTMSASTPAKSAGIVRCDAEQHGAECVTGGERQDQADRHP